MRSLTRQAPEESRVMQTCQPLLDKYTERIISYLQADSDHPRLWLPGEGDDSPQWTADEDAELRGLRIPALPTPERPLYGPDLVLYHAGELETLDDAFSERLAAVMNSDSHSLIVNTSGTGKTRLLIEILSRSWGLFFTCSTDPVSSPYGSMDMTAMFNWLPTFQLDGLFLDRRLILHGQGSRTSKENLQRNRRIARSLIYCVLLARLLVFNHVCTIAARLGISDGVLRRRWLFLQLRPHELLNTEIFGMISRHLKVFPLETLISETRKAFELYGDRLQFVALDEAQVAASSFSTTFALSDDKTNAPVLWDIVRCMAIAYTRQHLLVSGTHADLHVVADAVSNIPSPYSGFRHVYSLGSFNTVKRTTSYLRHFLGDTFTDTDCAEVHSLFQGRHRLLTVFLANVLIHGYRDMDIIMNSLHELLTGYSRPDSEHFRLPYALIIQDNQLDICPVARQAREATFRYALTREPTVVVSDEAVSVVALGLGPFCEPKGLATICEPLVFYRLAGWVLKSSYFSIGGLIRHRLRVPDSPVRGIDIAAGLTSYLWTMFSDSGSELSNYLAFQGQVTPFWRSNRARLVLPARLRTGTADSEIPTEHSVTVARKPADVFEWLRAGRSAFLIPDADFGTDLLFCLAVNGVGTLLVTLFTEPFNAERPRRVSTVSPKGISSFYAHNRKSLISVLREAPPLPFDLGSKRRKPQFLRLNVLRLLCFARAGEPEQPYNPPVSTLATEALLKLKPAPELSFSTLDDIIWGAFA
ncbi:hypothetical protein AURDEDRAFT_164320 [Auricularia subglabra TFB-10046 SS5]|nr:hypothetical protein AURDEDRAFT_164320 [Auricularia subglabra TFB-10046 SS5]